MISLASWNIGLNFSGQEWRIEINDVFSFSIIICIKSGFNDLTSIELNPFTSRLILNDDSINEVFGMLFGFTIEFLKDQSFNLIMFSCWEDNIDPEVGIILLLVAETSCGFDTRPLLSTIT